ncbi:unnamed protein product, partial [Phaeothamnion confervicola]
ASSTSSSSSPAAPAEAAAPTAVLYPVPEAEPPGVDSPGWSKRLAVQSLARLSRHLPCLRSLWLDYGELRDGDARLLSSWLAKSAGRPFAALPVGDKEDDAWGGAGSDEGGGGGNGRCGGIRDQVPPSRLWLWGCPPMAGEAIAAAATAAGGLAVWDSGGGRGSRARDGGGTSCRSCGVAQSGGSKRSDGGRGDGAGGGWRDAAKVVAAMRAAALQQDEGSCDWARIRLGRFVPAGNCPAALGREMWAA